MESPSAQDERLEALKNQENQIESNSKANTPMDLMEEIHLAREVLEDNIN